MSRPSGEIVTQYSSGISTGSETAAVSESQTCTILSAKLVKMQRPSSEHEIDRTARCWDMVCRQNGPLPFTQLATVSMFANSGRMRSTTLDLVGARADAETYRCGVLCAIAL